MELDLSFFSPPYLLNRRSFSATGNNNPNQQKTNMLKRTYSEPRTSNIDKTRGIKRRSLFPSPSKEYVEEAGHSVDVESSQGQQKL